MWPGVPLAAPSANTSGRPSPTTADHVMSDLQGVIPLVIDGGSCQVGVESTVLDGLRQPPAVLRPGGVTAEELEVYPGLEQLGVSESEGGGGVGAWCAVWLCKAAFFLAWASSCCVVPNLWNVIRHWVGNNPQ